MAWSMARSALDHDRAIAEHIEVAVKLNHLRIAQLLEARVNQPVPLSPRTEGSLVLCPLHIDGRGDEETGIARVVGVRVRHRKHADIRRGESELAQRLHKRLLPVSG